MVRAHGPSTKPPKIDENETDDEDETAPGDSEDQETSRGISDRTESYRDDVEAAKVAAMIKIKAGDSVRLSQRLCHRPRRCSIPTESFVASSRRSSTASTGTQRADEDVVKQLGHTNPHLIRFLLEQVWGIERARVLITVTGGAMGMDLDAENKEELLRGVMETAKSVIALARAQQTRCFRVACTQQHKQSTCCERRSTVGDVGLLRCTGRLGAGA
eukprot:3773476-Rhodomonas_salina.1